MADLSCARCERPLCVDHEPAADSRCPACEQAFELAQREREQLALQVSEYQGPAHAAPAGIRRFVGGWKHLAAGTALAGMAAAVGLTDPSITWMAKAAIVAPWLLYWLYGARLAVRPLALRRATSRDRHRKKFLREKERPLLLPGVGEESDP